VVVIVILIANHHVKKRRHVVPHVNANKRDAIKRENLVVDLERVIVLKMIILYQTIQNLMVQNQDLIVKKTSANQIVIVKLHKTNAYHFTRVNVVVLLQH